MSRFLLVVPPLTGHVAPLREVAARLTARGHDVAWAGSVAWLRPVLRPVLGPDVTVFDCVPARFTDLANRPPDLRGAAALRFLVEEYLGPLAEAMLPGTLGAVSSFRPHVVVADQQAYAGAFAAERAGVPWATSASTSAELVDPFTPTIAAWISEQLVRGWETAGGTGAGPDPRRSPLLILAYTTPALVGSVDSVPPAVHWVGPALPEIPTGDWSPPWRSRRPLVLVTLGTANERAGSRFLTACLAALAADPELHAVVVDPSGALRSPSDRVRIVDRVPQLAVLRHADLVVCHGGHNTVCESLWHGIPLVVAPIRDDQPVIAGQVVAAGAGVRLRFAHAGAAHVRAAVDEVLANPSYAAAAARVGESFRAAGGAAAAARALEILVTSPLRAPIKDVYVVSGSPTTTYTSLIGGGGRAGGSPGGTDPFETRTSNRGRRASAGR